MKVTLRENSWLENPTDTAVVAVGNDRCKAEDEEEKEGTKEEEEGEDNANYVDNNEDDDSSIAMSSYEDIYQQNISLTHNKRIANHLSVTTLSKISFLASMDNVCDIDKEKDQNCRKGFSLFEGMLLLVTSLNLFMMMGFLGCMGLFYIELLDEFSLSRSIASMVVSVPWGVAFGSGILTGLLINHYPCGLIIAFGSVMMSGGIIASSFASNVIFLVVCLGIFSGIGASFIFISSFIGTGLYFGQRGSYAIAIVSVAVPLGFLLYPLLAGVLISEFTWRGALLIFGGMSLNSVPFGLLIWRAELHQNMEEVVAVDVKSNIGSILTINKNDFTFKLCKEILANKKFWVFLMATSMLFSLITIIFNQITDFCIEIGYESVAGTALTIFNIPAFFGRLGSSLLLRFTRITPSLLFALSVTLFGLTMSLLPLVHNFDTTLAVIATAGLLQGPSSGIYTCVVIEVIGIQRAAPAQGMTDTFYGILTIITGYFAGLISEVTKSYKNGFILFSVLCTVSGLAHLVYIGVEWYQDRNRPYQPTFQDSNCKPVAV